MATSVLPYPTSPMIRRSIGVGVSMSFFTSALDGDNQPCVVGIHEQHEFARRTLRRHRLQPLELPDAVVDVNDVIASLEIAKIRDERAELRFAGRSLRPALGGGIAGRFAKDVKLGVIKDLLSRYLKPARQIANRDQAFRGDNVEITKHVVETF